MNDCVSRASALQTVLETGAYTTATVHVAESIVNCCGDLVKAGEFSLAIELCERALARHVAPDHEWELRVETLRAWALMNVGRRDESIQLIRGLYSRFEDELSRQEDQLLSLRIIESANFWQLNRADVAV